MDFRRVALLKPHEASWDAFKTDYDRMVNGEAPEVYSEELDEIIHDQVEALRRIAAELNLEVGIEEYELLSLKEQKLLNGSFISRRRTEEIMQADVIYTVQPPSQVLAYVMQCVQMNPLLRGIIGYQDKESFERGLSLTNRMRTAVFTKGEVQPRWLPKLFPLPIDSEAVMRKSMQRALLFPNIQPSESKEKIGDFLSPRGNEIDGDLRVEED